MVITTRRWRRRGDESPAHVAMQTRHRARRVVENMSWMADTAAAWRSRLRRWQRSPEALTRYSAARGRARAIPLEKLLREAGAARVVMPTAVRELGGAAAVPTGTTRPGLAGMS